MSKSLRGRKGCPSPKSGSRIGLTYDRRSAFDPRILRWASHPVPSSTSVAAAERAPGAGDGPRARLVRQRRVLQFGVVLRKRVDDRAKLFDRKAVLSIVAADQVVRFVRVGVQVVQGIDRALFGDMDLVTSVS